MRPPADIKLKSKPGFWIILLCLPIIIITVLELSLNLFNYGSSYELFISLPTENSQFLGINPIASKKYFTELSDSPSPRKDLFLKEKPKNDYRIFVIGGSTAAGYPFGNNLTFSRILNKRLSDTFPDKKIEIVNTAFSAINTYTQLDFMDEIVEQQPDAILIYTGHNEYYGALGVGSMESLGKYPFVIRTVLALKNFKTYQLLENSISAIIDIFGSKKQKINQDNLNATMMERIVKNKSIPLNSEDYKLGLEQFKNNLNKILEISRDANIPVILSELVSNVGAQEPFNSIINDSSLSALELYKKAKQSENEGNFKLAKDYYYQAKDSDALRFRAPEEFNKIIHQLASKFNLAVVPMITYFESQSKNQIIGNELMFEHLHPNKKGYFIMADAFFNTLKENNFISENWDDDFIKENTFYVNNWGFTKIDSVYASLSINQLKGGWPFKNSNTPNRFLTDFKPSTLVDSIVIKVFTDNNTTLEKCHIELASKFESKGELNLAYEEYKALIYTVPYFELFYEPALRILLQQKKYNEAMNLVFELEKYQKCDFTDKWIGQLYLVNNQPKKAIPYLENFVNNNKTDVVLIHNLCRAYYNLSEVENGDRVLKVLINNYPSSDYISELESLRSNSINNNTL